MLFRRALVLNQCKLLLPKFELDSIFIFHDFNLSKKKKKKSPIKFNHKLRQELSRRIHKLSN